MAEPPRAPALHLMAKPGGPRCNIDCTYCYYLEKGALFPGEKKFRMGGGTLEKYTRQVIAAASAAGQDQVLFAWHGGEPMLAGLEFYRKAVALQRKYLPPGMRALNTMQTNATLVDADWAAFLAEHGFLVGVSIDGPQAIHDRYRRDRAGRPTFAATMAGLEALQAAGVEVNLLSTVHRHNAGKAREVYRFLRGLGTAHLQFIPIVERTAPAGGLAAAPQMDMDPQNTVTAWSVAPRAYGKFLCDVFDLWCARDVGHIHVQYFEVMLGACLGQPASLCVHAETCATAPVLEHNGDIYACDHYVYPEYRLGNIAQTPLADLANTPQMRDFTNAKRDRLTAQCRACRFRFACHGGCPKHRFLTSRDGEAGHSYFCESYTMFLRHAGARLAQMAGLIRMGRPAAEIYRNR